MKRLNVAFLLPFIMIISISADAGCFSTFKNGIIKLKSVGITAGEPSCYYFKDTNGRTGVFKQNPKDTTVATAVAFSMLQKALLTGTKVYVDTEHEGVEVDIYAPGQ